MDYNDAVQIFFQPAPEGTPTPRPVATAGPARRLRDACEPIAILPAWSRLTNERLAAHGLNFLTAYVWGRAACLGENVPAGLVVSAFAAFEPGLITAMYEEGRSHISHDELLSIRDAATIEALQTILGDADVTQAVQQLRRGLAAVDGIGRALFSGLQARPWPDSAYGQLWRACDLIREHRGDSHIAAYITAGLGPVEMNILTELYVGMPLRSFVATRGWSEEAIEATIKQLRKKELLGEDNLTEKGLELRQEIEQHTDAMEQPIVDAIGNDLDTLVTQLNQWSDMCIEAKAFPPNIQKRAAG